MVLPVGGPLLSLEIIGIPLLGCNVLMCLHIIMVAFMMALSASRRVLHASRRVVVGFR